jgi:nucleoside-diphosphate-sugar epimerase
MNVLVTGGAGFIGSHLAEALVRLGHRVRVVDSFFSGRRSNLAAIRDDVELIEGDCTSPETARRAVDGVEAVFHEAAVPSFAQAEAGRAHPAGRHDRGQGAAVLSSAGPRA